VSLVLVGVLAVLLVPAAVVVAPFLIEGTRGFSGSFWRDEVAATAIAGAPMLAMAVRGDARAAGVPILTRVRRVVFACPEVVRASCHCFAALLADELPEEMEMRLWRPVLDVHPAIWFVASTFMACWLGWFVAFPPPIDWAANPALILFWVVQFVAFGIATAADLLRGVRGLLALEGVGVRADGGG